MGGQVERFGAIQETHDLYARWQNEAYWQGTSRLDVAVVAQDGGIMHYMSFFTPYPSADPGFIVENPGKGESNAGALFICNFFVMNGVVGSKAVLNKEGEWVRLQ